MIRTVEQYLESLDDGRVVYCLGERVKDVRTHPMLRTMIRSAAMDFAMPHDPRFRDLFVTRDEDGEDVNFLLTPPRTAEELLRRRECFVQGIRSGGGFLVHCMGVDALAAATLAANRMDRALKTNYVERVENYRKFLQKKRHRTDRRHDRCERRQEPASIEAGPAQGFLPPRDRQAEGWHRCQGRQDTHQRHPMRQ